MEAKDTVMSEDDIQIIKRTWRNSAFHIAQTQAEISFRAGIKEAVEWIGNRSVNELTPHYTLWIDKEKWQAKLKEWGINES